MIEASRYKFFPMLRNDVDFVTVSRDKGIEKIAGGQIATCSVLKKPGDYGISERDFKNGASGNIAFFERSN